MVDFNAANKSNKTAMVPHNKNIVIMYILNIPIRTQRENS